MLYRIGSSLAAADESLRRHDRYLERLETEPISRAAFRALVDADDPQLELTFAARSATAGDVDAERRRIAAIRRTIATLPDPKVLDLAALLRARRGRTVVFTAAEATARAIAGQLRWRRVALVTGRGARIASGSISVSAALDAFAPLARGARVAEANRADILVATDLASEGLDLQDADTVVHFDIPWTPQRLMQRLGRVARLGCSHTRVHVIWYPPPDELQLPSRLSRKERALGTVLDSRRLVCEPRTDDRRLLVRGVLRAARIASRDRNVTLIAALDLALAELRAGLRVGGERELRDLLREEVTTSEVRRWLDRWGVEG